MDSGVEGGDPDVVFEETCLVLEGEFFVATAYEFPSGDDPCLVEHRRAANADREMRLLHRAAASCHEDHERDEDRRQMPHVRIVAPKRGRVKAAWLAPNPTGIGGDLLKDALARCATAADEIGGRAVVVHTKDHSAVRFCERFGFRSLPENASNLCVLREDLRASIHRSLD